MRSVQLLDCTLRDGGYVNDWNFGNGNITSIFNRLCEARVDIIEIGFLDERRDFDINRTIQPDTESMSRVFASADGKGPMVVAMIDYGTCSVDHLQDRSETNIDGIRIIFKKAKLDGALAFAKQVKSKGYKVFLQMVSITSYSDRDLLDFVEKANTVAPHAVSIVDTYGLLDKKELLHYFDVLDRNLNKDIWIGYHSHNNFQLAYSNSIALLEFLTDRNILVDGTLYGMGKSAGNAPLELLAMHLNQRYGKNYDMSSILEAIDNNIMNIHRVKPWGYSYVFYIAASHDCHPSYVNYLLDKNTLSARSVDEILSKIPHENKLLYKEDLIESMYHDYQNAEIDDSDDIEALRRSISGKPVLLIGPGRTIITERDEIIHRIGATRPIVISVNSSPEDYPLDYVFMTNSKRYNLSYSHLKEHSDHMIATSNITPVGQKFGYAVNYDHLRSDESNTFGDNSLILMLTLLPRLEPSSVMLAGFDGFTGDPSTDYYDDRMVLRLKDNSTDFNTRCSKAISVFKDVLNLEFVTSTEYRI